MKTRSGNANSFIWLLPAVVVVLAVLAVVIVARKSSLGIELAAGGVVASAGFSFITVREVVRQSGRTNQQISLQQKQIEQASSNFLQQIEVSRHALQEAARTRLDAISPNAAVFVRDRDIVAELRNPDTLVPWPDSYLELDQQDLRLTIRAVIRVENYGPSPVLLRVQNPDSGKWENSDQGETRLIPPETTYDLTWLSIRPISQWRKKFGDRVSVRVRLRIDSLQNSVHDTHKLTFWFSLYEQDGSRIMLSAEPIAISSHGAAAVFRQYNDVIELGE